ncbi:hypothetical protein DPMN_170899 [Dreissena polymorpha]|uniref:Uncharacterized protein n=1 Tax=Dreissena polymorpha TaxID=45954 RepID=A0A9D4IBY3_DREPO|nr:hypothetical protein DPMN_170899 [Dreissena polymorpha]
MVFLGMNKSKAPLGVYFKVYGLSAPEAALSEDLECTPAFLHTGSLPTRLTKVGYEYRLIAAISSYLVVTFYCVGKPHLSGMVTTNSHASETGIEPGSLR